jgi:hypothetical protein
MQEKIKKYFFGKDIFYGENGVIYNILILVSLSL